MPRQRNRQDIHGNVYQTPLNEQGDVYQIPGTWTVPARKARSPILTHKDPMKKKTLVLPTDAVLKKPKNPKTEATPPLANKLILDGVEYYRLPGTDDYEPRYPEKVPIKGEITPEGLEIRKRLLDESSIEM